MEDAMNVAFQKVDSYFKLLKTDRMTLAKRLRKALLLPETFDLYSKQSEVEAIIAELESKSKMR